MRNYIETLPQSIKVIIIGFILTFIVYSIGPKIISKFEKRLSLNKKEIRKYFQIPLILTMGLGTIWYSIRSSEYTHIFEPLYEPIISTIILIIWISGIIKTGTILIHKTLKKEDESHDVMPIIENVWIFIAIIFFIFFIFNIWNIDVTPFLASAGIAGLIIGFAARDTIENFIGGIALYIDQTYYTGDFIELDENTRGWVREISIRSTVLHTLDGDSVTIPNSKLHKSIIKNKSTPMNAFRISIDLGVSYKSEPDKVQEIIKNTVEDMINEDDSLIRSNPRPQIHLRDFGDSSIDYEIFLWIELPNQKPKVQNMINQKLYKALEKEGIEIPYPQRTIHVD